MRNRVIIIIMGIAIWAIVAWNVGYPQTIADPQPPPAPPSYQPQGALPPTSFGYSPSVAPAPPPSQYPTPLNYPTVNRYPSDSVIAPPTGLRRVPD